MISAGQLRLRRARPDGIQEERDLYWSVMIGEVRIGSIAYQDAMPGHRKDRWRWAVDCQPVMSLHPPHGTAESREAAMAAFRPAWEAYRERIGDEGWQRHLAKLAEAAEREAYRTSGAYERGMLGDAWRAAGRPRFKG